MSTDRAIRRARREQVIKSRLRQMRLLFGNRLDPWWRDDGRLAKKKPLDCGKTRCAVCERQSRRKIEEQYDVN